MARKQRKQRGSELKARVALEAMRERRTVGELATQYGVHPSQIHEWKRRLLSGASELFQDGRSQKAAVKKNCPAELRRCVSSWTACIRS